MPTSWSRSGCRRRRPTPGSPRPSGWSWPCSPCCRSGALAWPVADTVRRSRSRAPTSRSDGATAVTVLPGSDLTDLAGPPTAELAAPVSVAPTEEDVVGLSALRRAGRAGRGGRAGGRAVGRADERRLGSARGRAGDRGPDRSHPHDPERAVVPADPGRAAVPLAHPRARGRRLGRRAPRGQRHHRLARRHHRPRHRPDQPARPAARPDRRPALHRRHPARPGDPGRSSRGGS